jgi:hypothetical protein
LASWKAATPSPEAKIDLVELEKLCSMQCTDEEVAAFFGVSARTIERRRQVKQFPEIMDRARAKGRVSVRRNLFRQSNGGNIAATIFQSKNLLGYKDVVTTSSLEWLVDRFRSHPARICLN